MSAVLAQPSMRQINLLNPSLLPKREFFSGRSVLGWVIVAIIAMSAVAWWAVTETRSVSRQASEQTVLRAAEKQRLLGAMPADAESIPTPQQIAAMDQSLRTKQTALESRRAALVTLKRVLGTENGGPSATLRTFATSMPDSVWLTELRATAGRLEVTGKTLDPAAVNAWLDRLTAAGYLTKKPVPAVRIERADVAGAATAPVGTPSTTTPVTASRVPVYSFSIVATLTHPFAEDAGGRQP